MPRKQSPFVNGFCKMIEKTYKISEKDARKVFRSIELRIQEKQPKMSQQKLRALYSNIKRNPSNFDINNIGDSVYRPQKIQAPIEMSVEKIEEKGFHQCTKCSRNFTTTVQSSGCRMGSKNGGFIGMCINPETSCGFFQVS